MMGTIVAALVVTSTTGPAWADSKPEKPTLAEAKPVFAALAANLDRDNKARDPKIVADLVAAPFLFELSTWAEDYGKKGPCEKKWKQKGTVAKDLPAFADCLAWSNMTLLGEKDVEWTELDIKELPPTWKGYKKQLAKLSKDHLLLFANMKDAGPAEQFVIVGATKLAGKVKVDTWLWAYVFYDVHP